MLSSLPLASEGLKLIHTVPGGGRRLLSLLVIRRSVHLMCNMDWSVLDMWVYCQESRHTEQTVSDR